MNRTGHALLTGALFFVSTTGVGAQTLEEVCPNSTDTGVLWGLVSDVDAEMALPGATVAATWEVDGTPGRAETQTALDGSYTLCYVPMGVELSVQASMATLPGEPLLVTLTEEIVRQDVGFSLTGAGSATEGPGDDKIWACIGQPDSQLRIQLGSLVRCDPLWPDLERCPKEELERVQATSSSGRRGVMRELVDELVERAERVGANALIRFQGGRGSAEAMAVKIDVDPSTC